MICVLLYNKIITKNFWLLKAVEYYRLKCVEFKLTCFSSHGNCHIAAYDSERNLRNNFRDNGIDFSGHNR